MPCWVDSGPEEKNAPPPDGGRQTRRISFAIRARKTHPIFCRFHKNPRQHQPCHGVGRVSGSRLSAAASTLARKDLLSLYILHLQDPSGLARRNPCQNRWLCVNGFSLLRPRFGFPESSGKYNLPFHSILGAAQRSN
jgi:hypothetical protein